jgi:hypothetical protein
MTGVISTMQHMRAPSPETLAPTANKRGYGVLFSARVILAPVGVSLLPG